MYIVEPQKLTFRNEAILMIWGGNTGNKPGDAEKMATQMLAAKTNSYAAMLFQVPNQPLFGGRVEDAMIAETFVRAIAEKDTTWPALFPMAKSAIRAMDAIQEIVKQERNHNIKHFVVTGGSKRGWTTWLTAATGDKRVIAIAPIVIDTLNMQVQMPYQLETWGVWSEQIRDYTSRGLVDKDPSKVEGFVKQLWEMVDPYSYRSRVTIPKLLVHGTNDPYWTVDATKNYWKDLKGVKYISTYPNVGHDLGGRTSDEKIRALTSIAVFARFAFEGNTDWPSVTWKASDAANGNYILSATVEPMLPVTEVKLWTAYSDTKDFRMAEWSSSDIQKSAGAYTATIEKPASGHVAYFIEIIAEYDDLPVSVTTQVYRQ